jgi:hypothetical protein
MHAKEKIELKKIGALERSSEFDRIMFLFLAVGVVVFGAGMFIDASRVWYNYLIEFFFFTCLALGGLLFTAVQYGASAAWSISVRRIGEGMAFFLPVSLILLIILFLGLRHIYHWSEFLPGDYFTYTKEVYLTSLWFVVRELFFFSLWILFAFFIIRNSLKQDTTHEPRLTLRNKRLSILFIIVFGYSFTFSSMDLLMSLEEHFYSTIFGVYCFAGLFLSGMAALSIIVISLRKRGYLENAVEKKHLHDLGTWLMAFSVFMVYIGFSQYMLIWYADLPHEISYLIQRSTHGWQFVFALLPLLKWILPFIVLMPEKNRANPRMIFIVAIGILFGQWLDIYWMVVPAFSESFRMISWIEIGIFLGFFGLFGLSLSRFYQRFPLLAAGDPSLDTCVKGRYMHV